MALVLTLSLSSLISPFFNGENHISPTKGKAAWWGSNKQKKRLAVSQFHNHDQSLPLYQASPTFSIHGIHGEARNLTDETRENHETLERSRNLDNETIKKCLLCQLITDQRPNKAKAICLKSVLICG